MSQLLQDRAALYVSGGMSVLERESFESVLEHHDDLRRQVASLQRVSATVAMAAVTTFAAPGAEVKSRLLRSLATPRRPPAVEALVVTDVAGRIEWVNHAFTEMCGYTLDELRGRKPGEVLQGPATDAASVQRIREGLRQRAVCRETLVNYHKDGSRYTVDVQIVPILDETEQPVWFIARERKRDDVALPA